MRVDGQLVILEGPILTPEAAEGLLREVIRPDLYDRFQKTNEADFAYSRPGVGRFRVNAFRQRGSGWCCGGSRRGRCRSPSSACPR